MTALRLAPLLVSIVAGTELPVSGPRLRIALTAKAKLELEPPVIVEQRTADGWMKVATVYPRWGFSTIDRAHGFARGKAGRFLRGGKVIGYWGSVPAEES
jgi:hypothetical protein